MRSLTSSLVLPWKMKCWKSCQCRNRPEQDNVHASRLLLPLGTATDMLVLVWSAPRRWQLLFAVPSSLLSCQSFLCVVATGVTRLVSLTLCHARCVTINQSITALNLYCWMMLKCLIYWGLTNKSTFVQLLISGDRQMWFSTCTSDSCTKRNWYCVCSSPQEAASDGWYWRLLHISSWTDGHSWQFW